MNIQRKDLEKSQVELAVELTVEEFAPYIEKGAQKLAETVKVEGFRPGKVPFDILKQKVGEMAILEEAAHIAVHKLLDKILDEQIKDKEVIGQPRVEINKLAPNNPLEFKVTAVTLPEIKLGEYKNLGVKVEEIKVNDEDLKKTLKELAETRATEKITDGAIKNEDKVLIGLEMFLAGVPVENGQIPETMIIVGKDYFVPGFDKQLVGAKKDAELKFNLVYPENHFHKNLAGKLVDFKVKVKEVYDRQIPEINDKLAEGFGFKKLAEMEEFLKKTANERAKQQADQKAELEMIDKIIAKATFGDLPEMLIQNESELMMNEINQSLAQQGGSMEDYLASIKKTKEQMLLDLLPQALRRVKSALILRELAEVEKIKVEHEDIHEKMDEIKKQYAGDEKIQAMINDHHYHDYLANVLTNQKIIKKLREWNIA